MDASPEGLAEKSPPEPTSRYGISLPMRCCSCCRRTVLVFFAITCYIKAAKSLLRLCVAYFSFLSLLAMTALETTTTTVLEVFVTTPSTSDDGNGGDTFLRLLPPRRLSNPTNTSLAASLCRYLRVFYSCKSLCRKEILLRKNWHLLYASRVSALRQCHTQCDVQRNAQFPPSQGCS